MDKLDILGMLQRGGLSLGVILLTRMTTKDTRALEFLGKSLYKPLVLSLAASELV